MADDRNVRIAGFYGSIEFDLRICDRANGATSERPHSWPIGSGLYHSFFDAVLFLINSTDACAISCSCHGRLFICNPELIASKHSPSHFALPDHGLVFAGFVSTLEIWKPSAAIFNAGISGFICLKWSGYCYLLGLSEACLIHEEGKSDRLGAAFGIRVDPAIGG